MEISERERARRKAETQVKKGGYKAQSFRLGPVHMEKLRKLSERSDVSQVELVRQWIDKEYEDVQLSRKR